MEKYLIKGGRKLSGKISVDSAKNSVLPIIAASILTEEEVIIKNCPKISDVLCMIKILESVGVKTYFQDNALIVNAKSLNSYEIPSQYSKELRASIYMMSALISRVKKAKQSYPGGCNIGVRPIDYHLKSLKSLGVNILEDTDCIFCSASKIEGTKIFLDFPSVGATENIMIVSAISNGKTEIHNAAKEPEVVDLMKFLNSMGAKIYGAGTSTILIEGVKRLFATNFMPMSDRIETGTYLISAAITGGEIEVSNCDTKNISSLIHKLCDNACKITMKNDIIYLKSGESKKSFSFSTGPYPAFPTDLQAQATTLLTVSDGLSVVTENVFDMRFNYVAELKKMGANIDINGRNAVVNGVNRLHGADVVAQDLRGGAALVLAGLNAEGDTIISDICHIKRGYLDMDKKLKKLGADITTII
jgi:UDP-N-acetylglucosamine 1-carboxyvinyltransferase